MNSQLININSNEFNIHYIIHKLYTERIQNELETLDKNSDRYNYLNNLLSTNTNNTGLMETLKSVSIKQCKKPWRRLPENYKITKIEEYCKEKNINDENKNKLLTALKNKKLKIVNVDYDVENTKIININFKF